MRKLWKLGSWEAGHDGHDGHDRHDEAATRMMKLAMKLAMKLVDKRGIGAKSTIAQDCSEDQDNSL